MSSIEMNRRSVLRTAIGVAGVAAMGPLLSACGNGSAGKSGANTKSGLAAALPTYVASNAVTPDIPSVTGGGGALTDPGFLKYPANLVKTVSGTPGSGGSYTAVTPLWGTIPAADNAFYQAVNKALGATLTMQPANGVTYNNTIPTLTAAKKLPDWIQLPGWWNDLFNVGELCGTQLADLTPYLAGDKVKQYPNLAAITTGAWQAGVWDNKLYGIPTFFSGQSFSGQFYYRADVFEAKGIPADSVKSIDDFFALGAELTSAKANVWAFDDVWTWLAQPFGISQKFTVTNGKLVHKYEQPEFLEALSWAYKLAKSGYLHPDALAGNNNDAKTRFYAGKVLINGDGQGAWNSADAQAGTAANKSYRRASFPLFSADGKATPSIYLNSSSGMFSYLNKNLSPSQIKECLAIADYLAAPFGTAEYTLINFGVEGVDYSMGATGPVYTTAGQADVQQQTFPFLATPTNVVSNPGFDEITKDRCAWNAAAGKYAYKPVFWNMNITVPARYATANGGQAVEDTIKDVYHGIKPVSAFQDAVTAWKKSGGDALVQWHQTEILDKTGTGQ
ncbi:ABC-type glycerol-3-phosphate transport system substrate-binding protein [Streptacidiphilus sp. MAP12-16]|uniref:ABC transporter substrate-binding protein n=1 Tax=Streptacidiphilus sp. MAP12-16 TaxID=3156300 RepID=UPI0035119340